MQDKILKIEKKLEEKDSLKKDSQFIIIEMIMCGVIVFCNLASKPSIVSGTFTLSFILLAGFLVYKLSDKDMKYDLLSSVVAISVISILCISFSIYRGIGWLDFNTLKNYFMFCSTIIYNFLMINIEADKKTAKIILILNIIIAVLYPIGDNFLPQTTTTHLSVGITLNFSNPNLTGMWILQSLLYLILAFIIFKPKIVKGLIVAIFVIDFGLLQETGARNCTIALFLFAIICLWIFIKSKPKFSKGIIAAVNVLPITFLFVYLKYIDLVIEREWFDFLINTGKNLTSRVEIWERNLLKIKDCWVTGSYFTAGGNTHNAHLVVLCSFGVITLICTIYFTYKVCCIVNERCKTKKSLYCLAAFFAVIFMGIGEGALYSGAMGIYILACGYLYVARAYSLEESDSNKGKNDG